jgi:exodeoxyribonuclease VII large subunit
VTPLASNNKSQREQESESALSVTEITRRIRGAIESDPLLANVSVKGEISNFTRHTNGNLYFSLKDEGAQIRAVMFQRFAATLRFKPEEGLGVVAIGGVSVYEKRGEYQLYIRYMQSAGVGALYMRFEQLKKKLDAEGLFDPARKKELPRFPRRIAVVTSPTGAAVRDVINIISRRFPAVEVTVIPALVQGEEAPRSLRAALARAAALPDVDTILLVRGGGSIEDLWGFNDEALARDIVACVVPIVSGVGHETDFTIADFVADLRAPTPSAAAELSVPDLNELRLKLRSTESTLDRRLLDLVRYYRSRLATAAATLSMARLLEQIDRRRQALDDVLGGLKKNWKYLSEKNGKKIDHVEEQLVALDPRRVLERGYAICSDAASGRVVRSVSQVKHGKLLRVTLQDGDFVSRADLKEQTSQTALDFDS